MNLQEKLFEIFREEDTILEDRDYPDTGQVVSDFLASQGIEADFDVEEGALELSDGGTPYRYDVIRFKEVPVVVTLLLSHCIGWDYMVSGVEVQDEETTPNNQAVA
jgi:hypothetical protein